MEDVGFVQNTRFGGHQICQGASLFPYVILADGNQSAFSEAERVLNVESSATVITVLGKIQHLPDSCVVHKLLLGQERLTQDVGADGEPAAVLAGAFVPLVSLLVC